MNETRYSMQYLRAWREHANMSQAALAEAAGMTKTTITRLEKGHHAANGLTANRIAHALGITRERLVTQQPDQSEEPAVATGGRDTSAGTSTPAPVATA